MAQTLVRASETEGTSAFVLPALRLALILAVGLLADALAGLRPARHAARLNVPRAITQELGTPICPNPFTRPRTRTPEPHSEPPSVPRSVPSPAEMPLEAPEMSAQTIPPAGERERAGLSAPAATGGVITIALFIVLFFVSGFLNAEIPKPDAPLKEIT
ncbi:hypothetical protein OG447_32175, partial [Streptomyces sp. NBC_01408]|nr:hypothetical protein [Streptomyces sp. NBC_01408]